MADNKTDATAQGARVTMNREELEIQKRLTLNWLIQGASQHAGITFHHFVRDELNALDAKLIGYYDKLALIGLLQYWRGAALLLFGSPARFWKDATIRSNHPFFGHPLLSKYGGMLAEEARRRCVVRCKDKGVTRWPIAFSFQLLRVVKRLRKLEAGHENELVALCKRATSLVWGIPIARLRGELVHTVELEEDLLPARNPTGAAFRAGIVGLGRVERRGAELIVVAEAINWLLLAKELVKGTAELICLHGLNQLDDEMYARVLAATDHVDLEPWMIQSGGELWRRLLQFVPDGCPIAKMLMHLARLPARELEAALAMVIEQREEAAALLARLAK